MNHPNFFDKIAVYIFPRFLFRGQTAILIAPVAATILHKSTGDWRQTDSVVLKKGSLIRFIGLAGQLHVLDKDHHDYSIFEVVEAYLKDLSAGRQEVVSKVISPGDTIVITPTDRQYVYPHLN